MLLKCFGFLKFDFGFPVNSADCVFELKSLKFVNKFMHE